MKIKGEKKFKFIGIFGVMKKENVNSNVKNRAYYQGLKTKYMNAAKEASSSGDRVLSEYNLQYAEHYTRTVNERFSNSQQQQFQQNNQPQTQQKQDVKLETAPVENSNIEVLPKLELAEEIKNKTSVKKSPSPIRKKKPAKEIVVESTDS